MGEDGRVEAAEGFGRWPSGCGFPGDEVDEPLGSEEFAVAVAGFGDAVGVEQEPVTWFQPFGVSLVGGLGQTEGRADGAIEGFDDPSMAEEQRGWVSAGDPAPQPG